MQPNRAYDEVIEFIAACSPENVIAFRPSEAVKARVADLIFREKTEGLPAMRSRKIRTEVSVDLSTVLRPFLPANVCVRDEKSGAPGAIPTRDLPLRSQCKGVDLSYLCASQTAR
jgi:hypothetical protein